MILQISRGLNMNVEVGTREVGLFILRGAWEAAS
jgi:hypothetical protein